MNTEVITDYMHRRMKELGHGDEYYIRLRHFVLAAGESRDIDGSNHLYFLLEPTDMLSVQSTFGFFDLSADTGNELQYEHQGKITITNYSSIANHIRFIQAIPKNK